VADPGTFLSVGFRWEHAQLAGIDQRIGQQVGLVVAQQPSEDAAEHVEQ
jgi:hypothetical protein